MPDSELLTSEPAKYILQNTEFRSVWANPKLLYTVVECFAKMHMVTDTPNRLWIGVWSVVYQVFLYSI